MPITVAMDISARFHHSKSVWHLSRVKWYSLLFWSGVKRKLLAEVLT